MWEEKMWEAPKALERGWTVEEVSRRGGILNVKIRCEELLSGWEVAVDESAILETALASRNPELIKKLIQLDGSLSDHLGQFVTSTCSKLSRAPAAKLSGGAVVGLALLASSVLAWRVSCSSAPAPEPPSRDSIVKSIVQELLGKASRLSASVKASVSALLELSDSRVQPGVERSSKEGWAHCWWSYRVPGDTESLPLEDTTSPPPKGTWSKVWMALRPSGLWMFEGPAGIQATRALFFDKSTRVVHQDSASRVVSVRSRNWNLAFRCDEDFDTRLWGLAVQSAVNKCDWGNLHRENSSSSPQRFLARGLRPSGARFHGTTTAAVGAIVQGIRSAQTQVLIATSSLILHESLWKALKQVPKTVKVYFLLSGVRLDSSSSRESEPEPLASLASFTNFNVVCAWPSIDIGSVKAAQPDVRLLSDGSNDSESFIVVDQALAFVGAFGLCARPTIELSVTVEFRGSSVVDLARQFSLSWELASTNLAARGPAIQLFDLTYDGMTTRTSRPVERSESGDSTDTGVCVMRDADSVQILRTSRRLSQSGESLREQSLYYAMMGLIDHAESSVLLFTNEFVSGLEGDTDVGNRVADAICRRILRAVRSGHMFQVLLVVSGKPSEGTTRTLKRMSECLKTASPDALKCLRVREIGISCAAMFAVVVDDTQALVGGSPISDAALNGLGAGATGVLVKESPTTSASLRSTSLLSKLLQAVVYFEGQLRQGVVPSIGVPPLRRSSSLKRLVSPIFPGSSADTLPTPEPILADTPQGYFGGLPPVPALPSLPLSPPVLPSPPAASPVTLGPSLDPLLSRTTSEAHTPSGVSAVDDIVVKAVVEALESLFPSFALAVWDAFTEDLILWDEHFARRLAHFVSSKRYPAPTEDSSLRGAIWPALEQPTGARVR